MPQTHAFWEENSNMQHIKYESSNSNDDHPRIKDDRNLYTYCDGNLNFATAPCSEDESEYGSVHYKKNKVSRQDPMSHRIIEKRRRDRMNNCLADLSRLIPTEYLKKGRGRIEKTEIIEMAIQYMKHLQQLHPSPTENYRLGYQECMSEAMRFLIEVEGNFPREPFCARFLGHLQKHCEALSLSPIKETAPHEIFKPVLPQDYLLNSKDEPNNNECESMTEDDIVCSRNCTESNIVDKHIDENSGSASYKYKTDIKMRFSQDVSAAKRPKVDENYEDMRRTSVTSIDNFSSSHGSSVGSFEVPRTTENSSPGNFIPRAYHFKIDLPRKHSPVPNGSQLLPSESRPDLRNNFNVPIFVLHTKGTFYIPVTIDYLTLLPFLHNYNILEPISNVHNTLHPVTINVNFHPLAINKYKSDFVHNNDWQ